MTELTSSIYNPIQKEGFSWNRVKMLYSFYFPVIKNQMIAYAIGAFIIAFASTLLIALDPLFVILDMLFFTALIYALYWNPIIFSRRNYHLIETILPVSGNEKVTFYFSYSFVVIPLIVIGTIILGAGITYLIPASRELIDKIINFEIPSEVSDALKARSFGVTYIISAIVSWYQMVITSLFAVTYFKKNKALMAIVLTIAISMVSGIIGAIAGFITGFNSAINDIDAPDKFLSNTMFISIIVYLIFDVVMTYYTIHTIKHRQL